MFDSLWQEIRLAFRMLFKKPAFTVVAALTLALGIGANITIFYATNAFLLRFMPVPEPDRLVRLLSGGEGSGVFSYPNYLDLKERIHGLRALAAHASTAVSLSNETGQPENARGELVTGNFFSVLGISPLAGRTFNAADDSAAGASSVVVISYGLWQRRFGGDPAAVGKKLSLNGYPFTVVGIMPKGFTGSQAVEAADLWTPILMYKQVRPRDLSVMQRGWGWMTAIGRLEAGVTLQQAQAEVDRVASQIQQEHPESSQKFRLRRARAVPEDWSEGLAKPLRLLTLVVALVLLVVSANIASVLLSRMIARRHDIAIRKSLGASRFRLMSQWMVESLLLALLGGVAGLLLSQWGLESLRWVVPEDYAAFVPAIETDGTVLLYTFCICLLTALICGSIPAIKLNQIGTASLLKEKDGSHRSRLFGGLITAQICLSFLLLVLAGLFLRSLEKSSSFQVGFNTKNLVLAYLDLSRNGYKEAQGQEFYRALLQRVRSLPEVDGATLALVTPLEGSQESQGYRIEGYRSGNGTDEVSIANNVVGPDYFSTMGIPILRGRSFEKHDLEAGAKPVIVINETMARRFWSLENAVGKTVRAGKDDAPFEIIGIARDIKYYSLGEEPMPYLYLPSSAQYWPGLTLQVRTQAEPQQMMRALQAAAAEIDPNVAIFHLTTFSELRKMQLFPARALALVCSFFGFLTLLLTAVGIYGTVSYSVNQRIHEIGIRMALGAQKQDVLRLFLRYGFLLAIAGIGSGCLLALWLTRFLSGFLFQVNAIDPLSFALVSLLLAVVAMLACYLPSRRATRINPIEALRYE